MALRFSTSLGPVDQRLPAEPGHSFRVASALLNSAYVMAALSMCYLSRVKMAKEESKIV